MNNTKYIEAKKARREKKKKNRRGATAEEVIYIFEKILEGWRTIKIYNTIIQNNKESEVSKKNVENISTGNSKVYESELTPERFLIYKELREKVYKYQLVNGVSEPVTANPPQLSLTGNALEVPNLL
jgi:hypothetical protein